MFTPDPAKLQRWQLLLAEHRAALEEIIRLAAQHPSSGALDACRVWADRTLRQLNAEARDPRIDGRPFGSLGAWGQNGKGPAIRSQLHSARTFVEMARRDAAKVQGRAA